LTVSTTATTVQLAGNGSAVTIDSTFPVYDEDDLQVTSILDSTGVPTDLTLTTDYTVAIDAITAIATVTLVDTPAAGTTIDVRSNTELGQPESIRNLGRFLPEIHEQAFDRLARQIQDVDRRLQLALRLPDYLVPSASGALLSPLSAWASKYMAFDADGVPEPAALSSTAISQSIIAGLLFPQTSAESSAGVTPIYYAWQVLEAQRYGYVTDGSTDNAAVWANMLAICGVLGGGVIELPAHASTGRINSKIVITQPNVVIRGKGRGTVIEASASSFDLFEVRAANVHFDRVAFYGRAASGATSQWAIYTAAAYASIGLKATHCYFGGSTSSLRLNNVIKYDTSWNYGEVSSCVIDEMQGTSNVGYGVLAGAVTGLKCHHNTALAASGRGRHAFYLSAGATYCEVDHNISVGFGDEHITMSALNSQTANYGNVFSHNICVGGGTNATTGAISIFGKSQANKIIGNVIYAPGQMGIFISGRDNAATDTTCLDNEVSGNTVMYAGTRGIELSGSTRSKLINNTVYDGSQNSAGASSNIRLLATASSGQACTDTVISGNSSRGANPAYALEFNTTTPIPTGIHLGSNDFQVCATGSINTNSLSGLFYTERTAGAKAGTYIVATYSASITLDARDGNCFAITPTDTTAFTINAPTNPATGQRLLIMIRNTSGGTHGNITWNAAFLVSTWTKPANGFSRSVEFIYNGANWAQLFMAGADVAN
jgi:parallel beta-helix repeat protein